MSAATMARRSPVALVPDRIEFTAHGTPAPQGSKSPKGLRRTKNGKLVSVLVESSEQVAPWRAIVAWHARAAHRGRPPLDGPLRAHMTFTLPRPASAKNRLYPETSPDLSKLARAVEDALDTDAGVLVNDARIVDYGRLTKVYVGDPIGLNRPGVHVIIEPMSQ